MYIYNPAERLPLDEMLPGARGKEGVWHGLQYFLIVGALGKKHGRLTWRLRGEAGGEVPAVRLTYAEKEAAVAQRPDVGTKRRRGKCEVGADVELQKALTLPETAWWLGAV